MGKKPSSFVKPQALPRSKWPDGTPKSQGNDFTAHLDGRPSIFANPKDLQYAANRASSTAAVEALRARGIEPSPIHGLSRKANRPAPPKATRA